MPANSGPIEGPCPRCGEQIRVGLPVHEGTTFAPPAEIPMPASAATAMAANGTPSLTQIPVAPQAMQEPPTAPVAQVPQVRAKLVPMEEPTRAQPATSPIQGTPPESPSSPADRQEAIVRRLHEYEAMGMPPNHPDRLHLLEEFFAAVSGAEIPAPSTAAPFPTLDTPPSVHPEPRRDSHLPPPRNGSPIPQPRPPGKPPMSLADEVNRTVPFQMPTAPPATAAPVAPPVRDFRPTRQPGLDRMEPAADGSRAKAPPIDDAALRSPRRRSTRRQRMEKPDTSPMGMSGLEKLALCVVLLAVVAGVSYAGMYLYKVKNQPAVEIEPDSISQSDHVQPPPLTLAEQADLKQAVKDYHLASSAEAKADYVLDGDRMIDRMRTFYAKHSPEPTQIAIDARLSEYELGDAKYIRGTGRYPDGRQVEFFAQREDGLFLIDWPSLAGYSEMNWVEFLLERPTTPTVFRVTAEQVEAPRELVDTYLALSLSTPTSTESAVAMVERQSVVGEEIRQLFVGAQTPQHLLVRLAYQEPHEANSDDPVLLLTQLIQKTWIEGQ